MSATEKEYNNFRIPVPPAFKDVFSHFYFAENNTGQTLTKTLLPTFQTILIFSFGTNASLTTKQNTGIEVEKCLVLGPVKQAFNYTLPVRAQILVANFKGDAFYRFFGNAVLADHTPISPDELLEENCFTGLWSELAGVDSAAGRVNHILEFCKPYLRQQNTTARLLDDFNCTILDPIKTVAQNTNQSKRNVQLQQKKYFGYSAKEINRYHRFLKAVELIRQIAESYTKPDWFEVINQCNYYDQSQLIHDFNHFIHLSPARFLKFQQDICQAIQE